MIKIFAVRLEAEVPVYRLGEEPSLQSFDPDTKWEDEGSFPEGYEMFALDSETGETFWLEDSWLPAEPDAPLSDDAPLWVPPADETYRPLPVTVDYSGERFWFVDGTGRQYSLEYTSLEDCVQMSRIWAECDGPTDLTVVSSSGGRWLVREGNATAL